MLCCLMCIKFIQQRIQCFLLPLFELPRWGVCHTVMVLVMLFHTLWLGMM